ncbi:MAG: dihydropteroate synthase [Actinomycetota bacterium]
MRHPRGVIQFERPLIMGVINASPESFSDSPAEAAAAAAQRAEGALSMVDAGATVIDVGGQSARTDQPEIAVVEEIHRVIPVITEIRRSSDVCISIDTYRAEVAQAALSAGADIINDVSGLMDPALLEVVARQRAGIVVMHTRLAPKVRLTREDHLYASPEEVVDDVVGFLSQRITMLTDAGVDAEQIVVDPGPDFAKTPAQTVAVLSRIDEVASLGRPVLLALSRKDFVGAATRRPPRDRSAGTLAAIGYCIERAPCSVLRVSTSARPRTSSRPSTCSTGDGSSRGTSP